MGILAKDGVVMASERKITSGLLAPARVSYYTHILSFITYLSLIEYLSLQLVVLVFFFVHIIIY